MVTDRDEYLFDLRGYLYLKQAVSESDVLDLNVSLDKIPPMAPGEWYGHIHAHQYGDKTSGLNLQQIYEAGEPFEKLIDHPAWIDKIMHFVGAKGTFDHHHGPLFIDENLANFREPGEAIGMHSGGYPPNIRNGFQYQGGRFMCGQVNILLALTEIGADDGGTLLIPGSHKSNFRHPDLDRYRMGVDRSGDGMEGSIEVFMKAGDVLLFADGITHGSAKRVNKGVRRIVVYRYGPSWGFFRHGYRPSPELLERLTPERRKIVWPHDELKRERQVMVMK